MPTKQRGATFPGRPFVGDLGKVAHKFIFQNPDRFTRLNRQMDK